MTLCASAQSPHTMKRLIVWNFQLLSVLIIFAPFIAWNITATFPSCGFSLLIYHKHTFTHTPSNSSTSIIFPCSSPWQWWSVRKPLTPSQAAMMTMMMMMMMMKESLLLTLSHSDSRILEIYTYLLHLL